MHQTPDKGAYFGLELCHLVRQRAFLLLLEQIVKEEVVSGSKEGGKDVVEGEGEGGGRFKVIDLSLPVTPRFRQVHLFQTEGCR